MPVIYGDDPASEPRRKRTPPTTDTATKTGRGYSPSEPYAPVATVEQASHSTLPTKAVLYLSGLTHDQAELARTARVFARRFDVPPLYVFGTTDPSQYRSPITGEKLTLGEANRFTNQFAPVAVASMLKQATAIQGGVAKKGRGSAPSAQLPINIQPEKVAAYARTLSAKGGDEIDLQEGMQLSLYLAQNKDFSPATFAHNLDMVHRWWDSTSTSPWDVHQGVSMAIDISSRGKAQTTEQVANRLIGKQNVLHAKLVSALRENPQAAAGLGAATDILQPQDFATVSPDYWKEAQALQTQVQLDNEAFQNSFIGKGLGFVGKYGAKYWTGIEKGLLDIGAAIEAPVVASAAAVGLDPQGDSALANWRGVMNARDEGIRRLNEGDSVGGLITEGFNLPHWTAPVLDFGIGWYADPLVAIGKASRVFRGIDALYGGDKLLIAGRTLPRLDENIGLFRRLAEKVPGIGDVLVRDDQIVNDVLQKGFQKYATEILPKSRVADKLYEAMYKGDTQFFRALDINTPGHFVARGLDYQFMNLLRTKMLEVFPEATAEARAAFSDALRAHTIGFGPEGSVAEAVTLARIENSARIANDVLHGPTKEADDFAKFLAEHIAAGGENRIHVPFSVELPSRGTVIGPRRAFRSLVYSDRLTETALGKRLAGLPNINPGRVVDFNDAVDEYTLLHARRTEVFTESEVRAYQRRALDIRSSGAGIEHRTKELLNEINDEFFKRFTKPYNLTTDAAHDLHERIFDPVFQKNEAIQGFMATPNVEGEEGALSLIPGDIELAIRPQLETQLQNFAFVTDPARVKQIVREYTGWGQRAEARLYHALGKDVPEITGHIDRSAASQALQNTLGQLQKLGRGYRRLWKGATVARPGYIPRVIFGDENARFMVTTRSITERFMGQQLWGAMKKLDDSNFFSDVVKIGPEETVRIGIPGAYERNPLATGHIRQSEIIDEMMRSSELKFRQLTPTNTWDVIHPSATNEAQHLTAWKWDLEKQFAKSAPGQVALESVVRGESVSETRQALMDWAKRDHYVTLRSRMGFEPEDFNSWFTDVAAAAHGYTLSNPEIATAALDGGKSLELALKKVTLADRPPVHGPSVEAMLQGDTYSKNLVDKVYNIFVRNPEERWNRQPYYKVWKRRADEAYYNFVAHQVRENPSLLEGGRYEPRLLNPGEDVSDIAVEGNHYYHVSPIENVEGIRSHGVLPRQTTYGIPEEAITPEMRGGRAFVAENPDIAMNATGSVVNKALIRIPREDVPHLFPDTAPVEGSFYSRSAIPTHHAEVLGADGAWHPLEDILRRSIVTPALKHSIDQASTRFALDQVRRVMFDLTRQSRFTELLQFIFPFPQPFFEGFQTWASIAMRNPEGAGRIMQLFRTGTQTGFIRKDPNTGEQVIPMTAFAKIAGPMWALGLDKPGRLDDLGLGFVAPLSSFNLLSATTIKFGAEAGPEGWVGKVIGGVPLPVPGLDPLAMLLGQKLFANDKSLAMTGYLFQYGPSTLSTLLPNTVKVGLEAAFPKQFPDRILEPLKYSILRAYQINGMDVGPDGKPLPLDELQKMAEHDAQELAWTRLFLSSFSPASLRVKTAASPYEAEWQQLVEDSPSYFDAIDAWNKKHPTLSYIPVGKTFFDAGIFDPATGGKADAPRLPSSRFVGELLKRPGIGDFMQANPAWAGLVLIGLDPETVNAQDFPTYSKMLSEGMLKYKPISRFLQEGEDGKVWNEVDKWYTQVYDPAITTLGKKGVDDGNTAYQDLIAQRQEFYTHLGAQFPNWAKANLEAHYDATGKFNYYDNPSGVGKPASLALAQARRLAETPGFESFPGFQGMKAYIALHDKIQGRLESNGFRDIMYDYTDPKAAQIRNAYASGVKKIEAQVPGIESFLGAYFGVRFNEDGSLQTTADLRVIDSDRTNFLSTLAPERRDAIDKFDIRYEVLRDHANTDYLNDYERSQRYNDAARFFDTKFYKDPKLVQDWWRSQGTRGQADYLASLATRPAVFFSAWDWHLQGVKVTEKQANLLSAIADARVQITKRESETPGDFSQAAAYKSLNQWVRDRIKEDPSFAPIVAKTNSWTFSLRAAGYDKYPGKVGHIWDTLLTGVDALQGSIDRVGGISGLGDYDPSQANWYAKTQNAFRSWISAAEKESPAFKRTFDQLTSDLGGSVIGNLLVPDTYFPLGANE